MLRIGCILLLLITALPASAVIRHGAIDAALAESLPQPVAERGVRVAAAVAISAKQAAAAVKQRYGGKILSVKLIESKGPPVYRVKTITPNGVVKVVFVDGATGEVFE